MSRIDDALRRIAGAAEQPRQPFSLERFASEREKARTRDPGDLRQASRADSEPTIASVVNQASEIPVARPSESTVPIQAQRSPALGLDADIAAETDKLIDLRQIADYVGFILGSLRRHKMLGAAVFAVALTITISGALLMPKTYYIQVNLLAQRNAVMTALSNPGRSVPWDADAPTRAAAETVLRRTNLISLIAQTDLIAEWERTRVPILKFKDWLQQFILRHTPTADEKLDNLVGLLEASMSVEAGPVGDGTVTIKLWWPDAEVGYRLVQAAQQAFLEARQVAETTAISESIGVLERYSASLHKNIDRALSELQNTQAKRRTADARTMWSGVSPARSAAPNVQALATSLGLPPVDPSIEPDAELNTSKSEIAAKRQELTRLEETRERQLAELQGRLAQLTTVFTAAHPSVLAVQQNIDALAQEPTQITNLKSDLKAMEAAYEIRSAQAADKRIRAELDRRAAAAAAEPVPAPAELPPPPPVADPGGKETVELGTLLLRSELSQLESVLERTDSARIELAVSETAFKYRYTVIRPAQVPREPAWPNLRRIVGAGFLGSLLLALFTVVSRDLLSNRILESWQVRRQLCLPILGTVGLG